MWLARREDEGVTAVGLCGWGVQGLFPHLVLRSPTEDGVTRRASVVARLDEEDFQNVWQLPLSTFLSFDGQRRSFPEMMAIDLTSQRNGKPCEHC